MAQLTEVIGGTRRMRLVVAAAAAVATAALATAGTATASDPTFVRAFGKGVNSSGNPSENPDVCTTSCQAGTPGSGAGEFNRPLNVAVAGSGDVYVADTQNNRIAEYTHDGTFVLAFGSGVNTSGNSSENPDVCTTSCGAGSGAGVHPIHPDDVAVAGSSDVYVADHSANRISEYKQDGTFVRGFGKNVNPAGGDVCTTSCQNGSRGAGAGQFDGPYNVAVAGSGGVYVIDYNNNRIVEYTQDGNFVRAFGKGVNSSGNSSESPDVCTTSCQAGSSGNEAGALGDPEGIGAASGSDVYVADWTANRIVEFTQDGTFVRAFGKGVNSSGNSSENPDVCTTSCQASTGGPGAGALSGPADIAIAPGGQLYVSDTQNSRVATYSSTGAFVRAFGKGVNSSGNSSENPDVCTTSCQAGSSGDAAGQFNSGRMWGLAVAGSGAVYVVDNNRIDQWTAGTATPTLTTQATHSVTLGQAISDTATVSGGDNPTGTVTFKAYANSSCSGAAAFTSAPAAVTNGSASSGPFTPTQAGSYYWTASYSGDAANDAVSSACNDPGEVSTVSANSPAPSPPTVSIGSPKDGQLFLQGAEAHAAYSCADRGGPGLASCFGPVANGALIDTAQPGQHSFAVTATDKDGNRVTKTVHYRVLARNLLSALTIKPSKFRTSGPKNKPGAPPRGTTISYRDSVAATTTITIYRRVRGIEQNRKCVKAPKPLPAGAKKCTRLVKAGSFTHADKAGPNTIHWSGKLSGKPLTAGKYLLLAVPRLGGASGKGVSAKFTVVD